MTLRSIFSVVIAFFAWNLLQTCCGAVFSVRPAGNAGFDVLADGVLVAPIRLAANNAIVAGTTTTNADGLTLSGLRAVDPLAATFGSNDFVRVILPSPAGTNLTGASVPTIDFKLTIASFNSNRWLALFPEGAAPFHFLVCSMPTAQVWHQRGWLNATPAADPFPLLIDPHNGSPEISCTWNRNWSYLCPLGGHPIPMIGLWDPPAGLYVGYDFQCSRASDQSERYLATAYCWGQGALTNFIALAYPYGGLRYGRQAFPVGGEVLGSRFDLQIDTALPATEDPNERFQSRLFERYTNCLPRVPAMNDLGWIPGGARLADFSGPNSLNLYTTGTETTFYPTGTVLLTGWGGHKEMPVDTAVKRNQMSNINSARGQIETLLTNYAMSVTIAGESCLFWQKPLVGAWNANFGGAAANTIHESEGWYAARVLVELYRYDRSVNQVRAWYLPAIDAIFNWAKHFVWTRNEFADVPSSPFAIGGTLCPAFLIDYYFTFRDDPQRAANATLALRLAKNITWRYLQVWAMDSDRYDGALDGAFLAEPNSGRDWAGLACANEVNWNIDTLTQVYVHTGDPRMRYYLRGMLQRWPALYQPIYQDSLAQYASGEALTEGLGLFDGSGPGRGLRYGYGFSPSLPLNEPVGASRMRVIAGVQACIAFDKNANDSDIADYRTGGDGSCSFRIVSSSTAPFDVSFSYPFVNVSGLTVTRARNGVTNVLSGSSIVRPVQSPSSLYLSQFQNGDVISIGSVPPSAPVITFDNTYVYSDTGNPARTNGLFITQSLTGEYALPQSWTNLDSFAGVIPGERWNYGIPYHQGLSGRTNAMAFFSPATAVILAYAPPLSEILTRRPALLLDNGSSLQLSGNPAPAWRGWPVIFRQKVLLDYAILPAGRSLTQVQPSGTIVMAVSEFTGSQSAWLPYQSNLLAASAAFVHQQQQDQAILALQSSYAQLPDGKIALLPLNTAGAAANFAAATGLRKKWVALTESQYVDTNYFTPSRFPIAFHLGSENYVKTVNTVGDGKAAVTNYLASGGTLVILASGPFPFYYGYGPADAPGPADVLLPTLGLPIRNSFETSPSGIYMLRYTNQGILHSVSNQFAFPPGDQRLRAVNRSSVSSSNRYVPLIRATDGTGNDYGDAAVFIKFGTGTVKNGRIVYVWSTLLSGPDGQLIMADVVTWILDAVLRPPQPRLNCLPQLDPSRFVFRFDASSNFFYIAQSRSSLSTGSWSTLQELASAVSNRSLAITNAIGGTSSFYRVSVGP